MSKHEPVTAEELAEIATLHRHHVLAGQPIPDWLGVNSVAIRALHLAARLARDLADARADRTRLADRVLDLGTQNETLREDLARSRLVNEQAEKVRDENDRLRGAIAHALEHAGTDSRTPEFTVFDTRDVEKVRGLAR